MECRRTPIHVVATADPTLPSIELGMRTRLLSQSPEPATIATMEPQKEAQNPNDTTDSNATHTKLGESQTKSSSLKRKTYDTDSIHEMNGDDYEVPRVIISLALEKHQNLNSESCQKWLSCCPHAGQVR